MPQSRSRKIPPLFPRHKQWQRCYDDWLRATEAHSGSTGSRDTYRVISTGFFVDPKRTPDQYTRAEVEAYIRRKVPHSDGTLTDPAPATQNGRLLILRSFYSFASAYDVTFRRSTRPILHTPDPTRGAKTVKLPRTRRALTEDELKQLFANIPRDTPQGKRDFALFSFYFWTARRRSEIVRLKWGDIFEVVFVEPGKKPRLGHMYRYSPKGHSREVFSAELRPEAWDALVDYLKASGRWATMTPDSPLFVRMDYWALTHTPNEPLEKSSVNGILRKYIALTGLDQTNRHVCVHSLRHTRARAAKRRGADIMEIRDLLGHASVATTMIYLQNDDEERPDNTAALIAADLGEL